MSNRRLAALMMADVAGYSRLVGADETGALASVKALKEEVIDAALAAHNGRLVKTMGDGFLIEFASAIKAVECATSIQARLPDWNVARPDAPVLQLRIGVHVGDVIFTEDGDVFGDGVNVTARLQAFAEPGSICLSSDAFRQVEGKLPTQFHDAGEKLLKNIERPVRVYTLTGVTTTKAIASALLLPDKPSIAVLPFANMSGDPEQEYFADGITEDVITDLSRFRWLLVIARNSSFTYKGRSVDIKQVGRELAVRYIIEGSVRRSGDRLRITAQLIDAFTGSHVWADRFDRAIGDIFEVQDEITRAIVSAIAPAIEDRETLDIGRRTPVDLSGWDHFLRARQHFYRLTKDELVLARGELQQSITLDPKNSIAHAMLAATFNYDFSYGWSEHPQVTLEMAVKAARKAIEIDAREAWGYIALAGALGFQGYYDKAIETVKRAIALNPNYDRAHFILGMWLIYSGYPKLGIEPLRTALKLNPNDPWSWQWHQNIALAYYLLRDYETAVQASRTALTSRPEHVRSNLLLIASLAQLGQLAEATAAIEEAGIRGVNIGISNIKSHFFFKNAEDAQHLADGLSKAGM